MNVGMTLKKLCIILSPSMSLKELYDQRTIRSNSGLPWINKELKKDMKVRKHLYDIAKRSNSEGDWSTYRRIKNQINNKLKVAHNNYCSRLFDDSFGGSKRQFWKFIKAKRKDDVGISTIVVDGKPCTDAKSKAEALNSYFKSVFTKEDTKNLPNLADPSSEVLFPNISDITFSVEGLRQLLSNLDTNKASGPDEIPSFILKQFAVEISPILQVIFTKSLSSGLLPSDWKKGNICPVFKKGRRDEASNYRPISLTSICSKTMEHIIFHNIMSHLNANDILIENQYGFRAGHSCATQLITLTEDILHALDHQKQVDIILLDFAKAFDTVPHQRLLTKLQYYGIRNNTFNWIKTWLTDQTQCVLLNGKSSTPVTVTSGVPQGTVLGPLMFLLYINDITRSISSPLRLFADDCLLYRVIDSQHDASILQQDLDRLSEWVHIWQLRFNVSKCVVIRGTRSQSPIIHNYELNNHTLTITDRHTYLGVLLDKHLSWSPHVYKITGKASRTSNFLKQLFYTSESSSIFSNGKTTTGICISSMGPYL